MPQAIAETVFDVLYLSFALIAGLTMFLKGKEPLFFGVIRNIPFAVMGIIIIVIFAQEAKKADDSVFRFMPFQSACRLVSICLPFCSAEACQSSVC